MKIRKKEATAISYTKGDIFCTSNNLILLKKKHVYYVKRLILYCIIHISNRKRKIYVYMYLGIIWQINRIKFMTKFLGELYIILLL